MRRIAFPTNFILRSTFWLFCRYDVGSFYLRRKRSIFQKMWNQLLGEQYVMIIFIFPFILIKCPAPNSAKRFFIDNYVFLESVFDFFHILCIVIFTSILFSFCFAIFKFFHWRGHLIVWLGRWFHTSSIHFGLSSAANFTPD